MPDGNKTKKVTEGDYGGGKTYPYEPNRQSTQYNQNWWASPAARDMLVKSLVKSGMKLNDAYVEADKNLASRISDANETEFEVGALSGADAIARAKFKGVREKGLVSISPQSLVSDPKYLLTHELAHIGTDNDHRLTKADKELYRSNMPNTKGLDTEGVTSTNELDARMRVFRQVAQEDKVYNPFSESFTEEHYDAMLKKYGTGKSGVNHPDQKTDSIQQFLRNTNKETAIGILNTVAQNNPAPSAWGLA